MARLVATCQRRGCGRAFPYPPSRRRPDGSPPPYCSLACKGLDQTRIMRPGPQASLLQRSVYQAWIASGSTLEAFGALIGVPRNTVKRIIAGRAPTRATWDRLRIALGDGLPAPVDFAEDLWRRQATIMGGEVRAVAEGAREGGPPSRLHTRAAVAHAAAARRGHERSAPVRDRIRAGKLASPAYEREASRLAHQSRSPYGIVMRGLGGRLRHQPLPSRTEIRRWAREASTRAGWTDVQVLEAWKPHLTARGNWALGGRPPAERRHYLIRALLDRWPRGTRHSASRPSTWY